VLGRARHERRESTQLEQLATITGRLARRNEALEDFAALVAHELKSPLLAALDADDTGRSIRQALELVDELLEVTREEPRDGASASPAHCLAQAAADLGLAAELSAELSGDLPLSPPALRVILRNLLANAARAGAGRIRVTADGRRLLVDDDGSGLGDPQRYTTGSGLGLRLTRRIAARYGAVLDLSSRPGGGARATLVFGEKPL